MLIPGVNGTQWVPIEMESALEAFEYKITENILFYINILE